MPCRTPETACLTQSNLVNFFLRAHYNVDTLTKPCKSLWSPQQAYEAYAYITDWCATGIVWGTLPICKSVGETGCNLVNTTQPCGSVQPNNPTGAPITPAPTLSPTTSSQLIVECGVTLEPSISPWGMGQCGNRTTEDPRVFGGPAWRTFHRFAEQYPQNPLPEVINGCVNFINALPYMIPCAHCGYALSQVS